MATYPLTESYVDGDVLSAADVNGTNEAVNDLAFGVFNTQTGTSYTLVLTDVAKVVTLDNAAAITLSVPANAPTAFPVGSQIIIAQLGAGQVTVSPAGGVTVNCYQGATKLSGQYAAATLINVATDSWLMVGNTAT